MIIASVVGARPQFVKLAPIAREFDSRPDFEHLIIHTGQHYDRALSDIFFEGLGIPAPDVHLGVGSGTHAEQTASILSSIEPVLLDIHPDWTLVYGDTNSTLAATIAAVKIHQPVAHLEAGLRSFNRYMPEEHNRVLTDHASDLLLAPTEVAFSHLRKEGLTERSVVVGDVMADLCLDVRDRVHNHSLPVAASTTGVMEHQFVLATIHRAENTDDRRRLRRIIDQLSTVECPVLLPVHPRLKARAAGFGLDLDGGSLRPIEPLSYGDLIRTVLGSAGVVTDSGGLQKEAFLLGVPCTTIRAETEWIETLEGEWNVLDPQADQLRALASRPRPAADQGLPFGDGYAARRVADSLCDRVLKR